jgi:hypothetical protein
VSAERLTGVGGSTTDRTTSITRPVAGIVADR